MSNRAYQAAFVISLLTVLGISWRVYNTFEDHQTDNLWVEHSELVRIETEQMTNYPVNFSNEIRKAVILNDTIISDPVAIRQYVEIKSALLDSLVLDNADQRARVKELHLLIMDYLEIGEQVKNTFLGGDSAKGVISSLILQEANALELVLDKSSKIVREEQAILLNRLEHRDDEETSTPRNLLALTIVTLVVIGLLFIRANRLVNSNVKVNKQLASKIDELQSEIDRRKFYQNLIKSVLDSSPNGILAFNSIRNSDGEVVDFELKVANATAAKLVRKDQAAMIGRRLLEMFPDSKEAQLFDKYVHVAETGEPYHTEKYYEYQGLNTWYDINVVKNGEGVVITFSDINFIKQHEQELLEKQSELEDTNYQLEQFAYIASHDLQEPLRKVRAFGDRLKSKYEKELGEQGSDYISRMQNASARMQTLIDDLLKYSRVSRAEYTFNEVNLDVILDEVLLDMEVEINHKQASITKDKLPIIEGDAGQMRQLFQNLISNSLKYSKEDVPPVVSIQVKEVERMSLTQVMEPCWELTFKDNGIGFDPSYSEQIFVIFKRLHGRSEYSGTGIGLAICEKIVTNHDGEIEAEGEAGVGATFRVYLPK